MRSRMDRYRDYDGRNVSRSEKNQDLYQNLGSNTKYTNFTDVTRTNTVDLQEASKNYRTREGYHQIKKYDDIIETPKVKRKLDEFNHIYQDYENRVYDINSVLEEARRNRIQKDELEAKRKLKNTNYNILAALNPDELEKYRKEKEMDNNRIDEDELKDLINTITSKTLAGEIDQKTSVDLLSDLMATNVLDKVEAPKKNVVVDDEDNEKDEKLVLSKEILDNKFNEEKENSDKMLKDMDQSFYTRSMDLSDKDFEMDEEFGEGLKDKKIPLVIKILLILILLAVVAVSIYYVIQNF